MVGGFWNAFVCPKVPDHVKEEIRSFMAENAHLKSTTRMMPTASDYEEVDYDEDEVELQRHQAQPNLKKRKGLMDKYVFPTPTDVLEGRKDRKNVFGGAVDKELRDRACSDIARWFYDARLPFIVVNYDSFNEALELVGQYGYGFKPPTMYELRESLLKKEVENTEKLLVEHKKKWATKGCSIMFDRWRDSVVQKDIINFLVNSTRGSVFIESIDVLEVVKDSNLLFNMLDKMVEEVGESNVVTVITDNASNYKSDNTFLS